MCLVYIIRFSAIEMTLEVLIATTFMTVLLSFTDADVFCPNCFRAMQAKVRLHSQFHSWNIISFRSLNSEEPEEALEADHLAKCKEVFSRCVEKQEKHLHQTYVKLYICQIEVLRVQ